MLRVQACMPGFPDHQDCYRCVAKGDSRDVLSAQLLVDLTDNNRGMGFGGCYLYMRNVRGFGWNHGRAYKIYRGFKSNPRIKSLERLVRE